MGADATTFAQAIVDLLGESAEARRALASQAQVDTLTWEACLQPLADILRRAVNT